MLNINDVKIISRNAYDGIYDIKINGFYTLSFKYINTVSNEYFELNSWFLIHGALYDGFEIENGHIKISGVDLI